MQAEALAKVKVFLLQEQDFYKILRTMVSRELEAIVLDRDMETLLTILEEKQDEVSRLEGLAEAWQKLLPELGIDEAYGTAAFWDRLLSLFPQPEAADLSQILKDNRAAADELVETENKVKEELEKYVEELRTKMRSMSKGRAAFIGYTKMGGAQ